MNFDAILFYLLALVLVIAAFRVVTATSPVTGVLHLILTFFTASMMWMLIQAEFLALLLVIVYVGAVLVMFLFVVMMIDVRPSGEKSGFKGHTPLGIGIGVVMVIEMAVVLLRVWGGAAPAAPIADDFDNTRALGTLMYTDYAYAVEVGGVVLLVGMIAAIALTLRKRPDYRRTDPASQVRVRAADRLRMVKIAAQTEPAATTDGAEK